MQANGWIPSTDDDRYGFPRQDVTDANLRDSLITLKTFMRVDKLILCKYIDHLN